VAYVILLFGWPVVQENVVLRATDTLPDSCLDAIDTTPSCSVALSGNLQNDHF
jgi:hypothetical protein